MSTASARKRHSPALTGAISLVFLAASTLSHAQSPPPAPSTAAGRIAQLVDELGQVRTPVTAAISPDGNYVAWTVDGKQGSELHLTGLAAAPPQDAAWDRILSPDTIADVTRLTPGACTGSHPAWSPNGLEVAFLSNCNLSAGSSASPTPDANKQENIWVWTPATNSMRQASHLHGSLTDLQWSPDSKSIGFLFVENATRKAGALAAMKAPSGVIGEDGVEVQRIEVADVQSGATLPRTLPNQGHVYEFSWAPNSDDIVFVGAPAPGENNWWVAKLYLAHQQWAGDSNHLTAQLLLDPTTAPGPLHGLQIAVPRFSPDGKQIAFIGGLMSDQGSIGGDIYLIPATGLKAGESPRNLTPNRPASPAWIEWRSPHSLLVSEHRGGSSHITAIDTETGKDDPALDVTLPETIIAGFDVMSLSASHTNNTAPNVALIRSSYSHPPEVWAGPLAHPDQLTQLSHGNDKLHPQWGKAESVTWTNDGRVLQGWLIYPANYDPGRRYPLVVNVHGGPSSAVTPRWPEASYGAVPFSALGYFVFLPNPRGSFGQGEAFTQANRKDFGYGDLSDILSGLDSLERRLPIDKTREDITGWSYGGFMTMFAVTQTNRFHAAVAGAGISNWLSYYGENSIDQWMTPFFGATVYDDPAIYARSSPINFIKNAKTPTLLVVGDRDGECPAPQSFEFWHALRAEGVKTRLVVYPNEGHHFVDPEHRRDVLRRALEWFQDAP